MTTRHARAALVLAAVVLPWVVSPRTGEAPVAEPSRPVTMDATAIVSLASIEVVTADRPTVSPYGKRGEGHRWISILPSGGLELGPSTTFARPASRSGWVGWSEPIGLHLAGRGPPSNDGR